MSSPYEYGVDERTHAAVLNPQRYDSAKVRPRAPKKDRRLQECPCKGPFKCPRWVLASLPGRSYLKITFVLSRPLTSEWEHDQSSTIQAIHFPLYSKRATSASTCRPTNEKWKNKELTFGYIYTYIALDKRKKCQSRGTRNRGERNIEYTYGCQQTKEKEVESNRKELVLQGVSQVGG